MSLNHLDRLNERFTDIYKEIQATIKDNVSQAIKEIFTKYPDLQAIGWVQYRPFFNDGAPCHFSIHDLHYLTSEDLDVDEDEKEDLIAEIFDWPYVRYDAPDGSMQYDLRKLESALNTFSEMLESLFSDAKIRAFRDKDELEIESYDNHD